MTQSRPARRALAIFSVFLTAVTLSSLAVNYADDAGAPPWIAPARAARKKNPVPADDTSVAAGKAIYIAQCLKCHGDAGKGDGPSANQLKPKPRDLSDPNIVAQTDGALFWKVTTGRTPMPTFEKLIPDDKDRWNVVNYMRFLAPPAKSDSASQPTTSQPSGN